MEWILERILTRPKELFIWENVQSCQVEDGLKWNLLEDGVWPAGEMEQLELLLV